MEFASVNSIPLKRFTFFLFATTIFVSAFLLFQVQPIMAKYILPWFGGSPSVWTTCMLVFQVLLFGGYAYAYVLNRFMPLENQFALHAMFLVIALCTLPITPTPDWKPMGAESPTWMIMMLLVCKVGAPYFLLSSTGPLLQFPFQPRVDARVVVLPLRHRTSAFVDTTVHDMVARIRSLCGFVPDVRNRTLSVVSN